MIHKLALMRKTKKQMKIQVRQPFPSSRSSEQRISRCKMRFMLLLGLLLSPCYALTLPPLFGPTAALAQENLEKPRVHTASLDALLNAQPSHWLKALTALTASPKRARKMLRQVFLQGQYQDHPMLWRLFYLLARVGQAKDLALLKPYWRNAASPQERQAMEGVADALHKPFKKMNRLVSGLRLITFKPSGPTRVLQFATSRNYWLPAQALHTLHAEGTHPAQIVAITPLTGKVYPSRNALWQKMRRVLGKGVNAHVFENRWAPLAQPAPFIVSRKGRVIVTFYNTSERSLIIRPHLSAWFGRLTPNPLQGWQVVWPETSVQWRMKSTLQGDAKRRRVRIDVRLETWGGQFSSLFRSLSAGRFLVRTAKAKPAKTQ